jgi:hypothetical protein
VNGFRSPDQPLVNDRPADHLCRVGSIRVAQRSWLSTSSSVTVITSVAPSIATCPKNCRPKQGARLSPCSLLQPFW